MSSGDSDQHERPSVDFVLPDAEIEDVVAALKQAAADLSGDTGSGYVRSLGPVRVLRSRAGSVCHVAIPVTLGDPWDVEEDGQSWQASASYKGRLVFSLVADADNSVCVKARAEGDDGCDLRSATIAYLSSRFQSPEQGQALRMARLEAVSLILPVSQEPEDDDTDGEYTPTDETERRALEFREIKESHSHWSQKKVAEEATRSLKLRWGPKGKPPTYDRYDVQNAYRAMRQLYPDDPGWVWQKGDRTAKKM